jgi:flagellar basal-body rod protein FlgF
MDLNGITGVARTLSYYTRRQEITAGNLAQSNTEAFKSLRVAAHGSADGGNPVPVQWTDWTQGNLRQTGRSLDFALEGPGFLVVETPQGDRLTRGGSLQLDPDGCLTDLSGHPVLGMEGPLHLFGTSVEVAADGSITVDGAPAGRLQLAVVDDPQGLERQDGGLFNSSAEPQPAPEGTVEVRQGAVEDANLDPVTSLVDLLSIQRAYAANVQALKAMDRVLSIAASEVGDTR